jgi:protein phosphatase PTC2/3
MIAGIWDCLSSQDVVNFVRYQVSKGKELTEIGEMMCDHCLAPDTNSENLMIGCDNMSVLIVAITHGRSKKEWYTWIAERVENRYGYETPSALPELYSQSRLDAFCRHKERHDKQQKEKEKEKLAAERNASTSSQSAPSSENGSSAVSDELPKSNAIGARS